MAKKRDAMELRLKEFFTVWRVLVLAYAVVFSLILAGAVSEFITLPSPMYGGDYYFQMGCFHHIMEGGNPLDSSSMNGQVPGYMPIYPFVGSIYCAVAGSEPMECMIDFSVLIFFFSVIFWFITLSAIFKDERTAFFATILATSITAHPVLKYTNFVEAIIIPLFLFALYKTFEEKKIQYFAILGIFYGLAPLSHMMFFIGATFITGFFFLYEIYSTLKKKESGELKKLAKNIAVFAVLALPLLMMYWYRPIFEWGLHMPYDRTHMDVMDMADSENQMQFLAGSLSGLLNFTLIQAGITLLFLFGIYTLIKTRKNYGYLEKFLVLFAIASVAVTFSYFITEPLLGMNFIPAYMKTFTYAPAYFLISIYGLNIFLNKTERFSKNVKLGIVVVYLLLFLFYNFTAFNDKMETNQWMLVGKTQEMPGLYASLQDYITGNTDVNDVFLSTKELSFLVNSLTGRKLMVNRWAQQNNPYTDMPQRDEDAAIIFYGDSVSKKLELLEEYDVKYLYWDYYWINSEYQFNDQGQVVNIYDPLLTMDDQENRNYLGGNGVKYQAMHTWIDPAMKGDHIRQYDLLLVSPENYQSFEHPWNSNLDPYLEKVWEYEDNGVIYGVLYKINIGG